MAPCVCRAVDSNCEVRGSFLKYVYICINLILNVNILLVLFLQSRTTETESVKDVKSTGKGSGLLQTFLYFAYMTNTKIIDLHFSV